MELTIASPLDRAAVLALVLAISSAPLNLVAQGPTATPKCAHLLETPKADSVTVHAVLTVHARDRSHDLPDWFQEDVATAIRLALRLPRPLEVAAYETDWERPARTAHPAFRSELRAVITKEGRIREPHVTGGVRNDALDGAILAAIQQVDSVQSLKESAQSLQEGETPIVIALSSDVPALAGEPVRRLRRENGIMVSTGAGGGKFPESPVAEDLDSLTRFPLFGVRTPLLTVTRAPQPIPGFGMLRYPDGLRGREDGFVSIAVVVGADGRAEEGTTIALAFTRREFMQSVLNALPNFRFHALEVEGCVVRSLERMPFTFQTGR